jgi:hypothetical protein
MSNRAITISLAAIAIGALAWIDPLFLPLVTLGPLVAGFAVGALGSDVRAAALPWFLGGLLMLVGDLVINGEDVLFHMVLAVFAGSVAAGAAAIGRRARRLRRAAGPAVSSAG